MALNDYEPLYYELTDDSYFVDYANMIVTPKGGKHWKLAPDATYIVRILLQKVRVGMVAKILAELKFDNNYDAALTVVVGLIQELERKTLIQRGPQPEILMSGGDKATEGTRQQTLTTAILPKVPGRY
jgi:hypothetical protein